MINPLIPLAIRIKFGIMGINLKSVPYEKLFSCNDSGLRDQWNMEFPFYYAQISPYRYKNDPKNEVSQKLRES